MFNQSFIFLNRYNFCEKSGTEKSLVIMFVVYFICLFIEFAKLKCQPMNVLVTFTAKFQVGSIVMMSHTVTMYRYCCVLAV